MVTVSVPSFCVGSEDPVLAPMLGAFSLGLRPTPHGSVSHFCCNPDQTSVAGKVIGPGVESAIAFLINDHIIKLPSKRLSLYT